MFKLQEPQDGQVTVSRSMTSCLLALQQFWQQGQVIKYWK
jgi:hypothetical protein